MIRFRFLEFFVCKNRSPEKVESSGSIARHQFARLLRRSFAVVSLRRLGAMLVFLGFSSVNSYAQVASTFADCNALNGTTFLQDSQATSLTVTDTFTVTSLLDSDLITITVADVDQTGTSLGNANIQVTANGATLISATIDAQADPTILSASSTFDPGGDLTNVAFNFTTVFTDSSTGAGIEMAVTVTIQCTPNSGTSTTTAAFLAERNRRILEESPDRPRLVRRRLDSLWGGATGESEPSNLSSFSAAANKVRAHIELGSFANTYGADLPPAGVNPGLPPAAVRESCWDAWAEFHYTRYSDAGDRDGDFAIGYVGVDCQIQPSVMLGFLGQFDRTDDEIGSVSSQIDGNGWMVGPYATVRLTPDLFFDFRAAWGQSDNDINIAGVTGNFETTRWLVEGQLTGNFLYGDYRISPEIKLSYIEENQDSYFDSANSFNPSQTVSLGRLRFGPEIAYRRTLDNGMIVEPHISLRGIWDFDSSDVTVGTTTFNGDGFRGVVEAGILFHRADDFNVRISAKYDGIGVSDFDAIGGQIWINIPLN